MDMSTDGHHSFPRGIKRVELKVTLVDTMVERGLAEFGLELESDPPGEVGRRNVWSCERIDADGGPTMLPLLSRGIILRVRRDEEDGSGVSTLKLRGPEGGVDSELWRERTDAFGKGAKIEGDWVADHHLVAASLDSDVEGGRIDKVVAAGRPHQVEPLFSREQEMLAAELLLGFDGLELLGPVDAWKWKLTFEGLEDELAAEMKFPRQTRDAFGAVRRSGQEVLQAAGLGGQSARAAPPGDRGQFRDRLAAADGARELGAEGEQVWQSSRRPLHCRRQQSGDGRGQDRPDLASRARPGEVPQGRDNSAHLQQVEPDQSAELGAEGRPVELATAGQDHQGVDRGCPVERVAGAEPVGQAEGQSRPDRAVGLGQPRQHPPAAARPPGKLDEPRQQVGGDHVPVGWQQRRPAAQPVAEVPKPPVLGFGKLAQQPSQGRTLGSETVEDAQRCGPRQRTGGT
jgi:hypothetical protein